MHGGAQVAAHTAALLPGPRGMAGVPLADPPLTPAFGVALLLGGGDCVVD